MWQFVFGEEKVKDTYFSKFCLEAALCIVFKNKDTDRGSLPLRNLFSKEKVLFTFNSNGICIHMCLNT